MSIDLTSAAEYIFKAALCECGVRHAFTSKLLATDRKPYAFTFRAGIHEEETIIDLSDVLRLVVIAVGKAGGTMLQGLLQQIRLPEGCHLSGVLIAPQPPDELPQGIRYYAGGHPFPSQASFEGARAVLELLSTATRNMEPGRILCLFLISGGASAMMELPLDTSISLADTVSFHRALVQSGASIGEINCVRKHFSAVKGGRLGVIAAAIPNLSLLVSDVPTGELDTLASGPTLPDRSTVSDCKDIVQRYGLREIFTDSVRSFFDAEELPETPKPGAFAARVFTLLSSDDLAEAARREALSLGFTVFIDNSCDDWDYRRAADYLLNEFRVLKRTHKRVCLISAGEVTVRFEPLATHADMSHLQEGNQGMGGRNQHFALYAATLLNESDEVTVILSAGSDGIDGNSPFAGAVVDRRRVLAGCDVLSKMTPGSTGLLAPALDALSNFDSSTFLRAAQATLETGPTGNNLRDLRLFLSE